MLARAGAHYVAGKATGKFVDKKLKERKEAKATKSKIEPSVWGLEPKKRGVYIEKKLEQNLVSNFPIIDKWSEDTGTATSIKSLDLNAKTYQKISKLRSVLKGYINKVAAFKGIDWGIVKIQESQICRRCLELALPHTGNTMQKKVLENMLLYAEKQEVTLKIIT